MIELVTAFRDFFYHGREKELKNAYNLLVNLTNSTPDESIDWEQEEFIFNRLFVGPAAPEAPMVASVYLDPENLIQNRTTSEIREFYEAIGLSIPDIGREPEDSLAYELDACRYLLSLYPSHLEAEEAYHVFIDEHLSEWLPLFISRAKENSRGSKGISKVLDLLDEWISQESAKRVSHKELS